MSGGAFVYVPRGVLVEHPIQIVVALTEPGQSGFPHTLLIAEPGADVTCLETYVSDDRVDEILCSSGVELASAPGARVQYVNIQEWNERTWHFADMHTSTDRDSSVRWVLVSLGSHLARTEVSTRLMEPGSEAEISGLVFGDHDQHFDLITLQDHIGSHTQSELLFKAALRDRGSSNFNGLIRVHKDAAQTSSNLVARNLLLSSTAKADADPRLEILNSDVLRCAHGATVGPMDEDVLFYVMSRGLDRKAAQRLVIEAFYAPVLESLPLETVRQRVWSSIQRGLGDE